MGRRKQAAFQERARRKARDEQIRRQYRAIGVRDVTVDRSRLMAGIANDVEKVTAGWRTALPGIAEAAAQRGVATAAARLGVHHGVGWPVNPDVVGLGTKALWRLPSATLSDVGRLFTRDPGIETAALRAGLDAVLGGAGGTASMAVNSTEGLIFNGAAASVYAEAGEQWQWIARCGPTTCAFCWEMHGQVFDASETLDSHPNCACEMRPVNGGDITSGADRFYAAPARLQEAVLGPVAFDAFRRGEIVLSDLVAHSTHPVLGRVGGTASLTQVLGKDRVRTLRRRVLYGR